MQARFTEIEERRRLICLLWNLMFGQHPKIEETDDLWGTGRALVVENVYTISFGMVCLQDDQLRTAVLDTKIRLSGKKPKEKDSNFMLRYALDASTPAPTDGEDETEVCVCLEVTSAIKRMIDLEVADRFNRIAQALLCEEQDKDYLPA